MPARGEAGQDRAQSSSRMDSACGFRDAALQGGFQAAPARDPPHRRGCHPRRTSLYGSEDTLEAPPALAAPFDPDAHALAHGGVKKRWHPPSMAGSALD
jgi:hypothetical protein